MYISHSFTYHDEHEMIITAADDIPIGQRCVQTVSACSELRAEFVRDKERDGRTGRQTA